MILQLSGLCWRLVRDSCKASARSKGKRFTRWALGVRSHTCAFSSSPQQRYGANQHDDQRFQSSCWSILSSSPSTISSSISLSQIQKISIPLGRIPLLAILLTPAHIGLLEGTADFLPNVLRHTFDLKDDQQIDVVAAVVDRIPYPTSARPANWIDVQPLAEVAPPETQIEDGSEGMSFAVLDSNSAAPDLWSARAESKHLSTMPIQQHCTLSFAFPPTAITVPVFPDGKERTQPLVSRVLQLPVANTLFTNGMPSTLIAQRWRSRQNSESSFTLSCIQKARLPQQTLRLTDVCSDQSTGFNQSLHSYLMPITPTRTVTAAIGNIIRRISIDDTSEEGVPASEELENAISAAIRDGRIPTEQAGIWALVRPPNYPSPGHSGDDIGETAIHEIQRAVLTGCQLHKVLSGGGGWGEKQGLLALDPDSDYHTRQQAFGTSYWEDQGVEPEEMQAFVNLVNPGDTVKFFVYKSPQILESISEAIPRLDPAADLRSLSLRFGSLPSSMDAMPEAPITETDSSSQPGCTVIKHHFGMLSEQGMSLESTFLETDLRASNVQYLVPEQLGHGLPPFEVLDKLVLTTKLDAPYMTWSIEEDIQAVDPTSEVIPTRSQPLGEYAHIETPQKRTRTGINAIKSTMTRSHEAKWEASDDFMEAVSTMPPHQHVATMDSHPRDRRQAKGKAGGLTYSTGLAIGREVAKLWGRPSKQLIRKFEKRGPEVGAASIPLSKFSQVQSHIQTWVKRSGEREVAIEHLERHDTNAYQRNKMDIAHTIQQPPKDITSVKSEDMEVRDERRPRNQVYYEPCPIRKHEAKLPTVHFGDQLRVMIRQLASSVRKESVLGPSSEEEDDMVAEGNLAGNDSEESVRHRALGAWEAWFEQQSAMKDEPETKKEASRVPFIPKNLQETLPVSHSGSEGEAEEQLENSKSESAIDSLPMEQRTSPEQARRLSDRVIRRVGVLEEPGMVVRKHLGLVTSITEKHIKEKKFGGRPKSEVKDVQVRKHLSHDPPPRNARDKAKKLHEEYHLPLLDERPEQAPRP